GALLQLRQGAQGLLAVLQGGRQLVQLAVDGGPVQHELEEDAPVVQGVGVALDELASQARPLGEGLLRLLALPEVFLHDAQVVQRTRQAVLVARHAGPGLDQPAAPPDGLGVALPRRLALAQLFLEVAEVVQDAREAAPVGRRLGVVLDQLAAEVGRLGVALEALPRLAPPPPPPAPVTPAPRQLL